MDELVDRYGSYREHEKKNFDVRYEEEFDGIWGNHLCLQISHNGRQWQSIAINTADELRKLKELVNSIPETPFSY